MTQVLTFKVDVTGLSDVQIDSLTGALYAQCEAYDDDSHTDDEPDSSYPDVPILSVFVA